MLFLRSRTGELLSTIAPDVKIVDTDGRRAFFLAPRLARWLRAERVDLIYSGTNAANLVALAASRMIARGARPSVIISEHTSAVAYLAGAKGRTLRRGLIRRLYPLADLLLLPTDFLAHEWLKAIGPRAPAFAVAPNPILEPKALAQLHRAPPRRVPGRVICAGRLIADKGHDTVIRAVASLAPEMPNLHLKIFGAGPQEPALAAMIAQLEMVGRITLDGVTPTLLQEMAAAEVLALGSRREGFGNVVVEGLAAGARLVATDCPGPRTILAGGKFGTLVAKDDPVAMADALRAALGGPTTSATAPQIAAHIETFLVPTAVAAFAEICEAVMNGSADSRATVAAIRT